MSDNSGRKTVSFEELSYSNMLTLAAIVELLDEKGILKKGEILEKVKQIRIETPQARPQ